MPISSARGAQRHPAGAAGGNRGALSVTAGDIWIRPALCLPSTRTAFFSMAMAWGADWRSDRNQASCLYHII